MPLKHPTHQYGAQAPYPGHRNTGDNSRATPSPSQFPLASPQYGSRESTYSSSNQNITSSSDSENHREPASPVAAASPPPPSSNPASPAVPASERSASPFSSPEQGTRPVPRGIHQHHHARQPVVRHRRSVHNRLLDSDSEPEVNNHNIPPSPPRPHNATLHTSYLRESSVHPLTQRRVYRQSPAPAALSSDRAQSNSSSDSESSIEEPPVRRVHLGIERTRRPCLSNPTSLAPRVANPPRTGLHELRRRYESSDEEEPQEYIADNLSPGQQYVADTSDTDSDADARPFPPRAAYRGTAVYPSSTFPAPRVPNRIRTGPREPYSPRNAEAEDSGDSGSDEQQHLVEYPIEPIIPEDESDIESDYSGHRSQYSQADHSEGGLFVDQRDQSEVDEDDGLDDDALDEDALYEDGLDENGFDQDGFDDDRSRADRSDTDTISIEAEADNLFQALELEQQPERRENIFELLLARANRLERRHPAWIQQPQHLEREFLQQELDRELAEEQELGFSDIDDGFGSEEDYDLDDVHNQDRDQGSRSPSVGNPGPAVDMDVDDELVEVVWHNIDQRHPQQRGNNNRPNNRPNNQAPNNQRGAMDFIDLTGEPDSPVQRHQPPPPRRRPAMANNIRPPSLARSDASILGRMVRGGNGPQVIDLTNDDPPGEAPVEVDDDGDDGNGLFVRQNNDHIPANRRLPHPVPAPRHNGEPHNYGFGLIANAQLRHLGARARLGFHQLFGGGANVPMADDIALLGGGGGWGAPVDPLAGNPPIFNYAANGFAGAAPPAPPKPQFPEPPPARPGFTRNTGNDPETGEEQKFICAGCDEELKYYDDEGEGERPAKRPRHKKDREEHHFWAVKACGHVYCKSCYEDRKKVRALGDDYEKRMAFRVENKDTKTPKIHCAVEDCQSEVTAANAWVGIFI